MVHFAFLFCLVFLLENAVATLRVSLANDGPVVRGSNITFTATVSGHDGSEKIQYVFWDNAQPQHTTSLYLTSNVSKWTVEYSRDLYEAGEYTARVDIKRNYIGIYIVVDSSTTTFKLTESLNGNLTLNQNNTERPNSFVAVNQTVNYFIRLPDKELEFLKSNSSSIITYWFMDCMFIDMTTDFRLNYTYSDTMNSHYIDALVVANHDPLPPLVTTTTTTTTPKPNITTVVPTTTIVPPPTTIVPPTTTIVQPTTTIVQPTAITPNTTNTNSTLDVHKLAKRAVSNKTFKKKLSPLKDFICTNSIVPIGDSYTYGHYQETINVREPIGSPVNITGLNWLQHEDLMNLQVKYTGSPPFFYCAMYKLGQYNITGNETCGVKTRTVSNVFQLVHYFSDTDQHTVVVIIENDIGKVVSRATINIYKVSVHPQLSVIVVPVVFCLLAVILVVFGAAYLHRSRHSVEVADFDFGQQSHLDYKTFTERLRDSFRDAFKFGNHDDTDPLTANTRYDSMT